MHENQHWTSDNQYADPQEATKDNISPFPRRLTANEARTVELPSVLHPIQRLGRLAELGAGFGIRHDGYSPIPLFFTRRDLVRTAEISDKVESSLNWLQAKSEQERDKNNLGPIPEIRTEGDQ